MPKGQIRPLRCRDFLNRLKQRYDIVQMPGRGKGSEIILVKPNAPGSRLKGPQFVMRHHKDSEDVYPKTIAACLRHFQIDPKDFFPD